jgi:hypothetical protein
MAASSSADDAKCINTIRVVSADMVEKANSGHPGEKFERIPWLGARRSLADHRGTDGVRSDCPRSVVAHHEVQPQEPQVGE